MLCVLVNGVVLIALAITMGSAFYSISPISNGSFRASRVETTGLIVNPSVGAVDVRMLSVEGDTELSLRGVQRAGLSLGETGAAPGETFSLVTERVKRSSAQAGGFSGGAPSAGRRSLGAAGGLAEGEGSGAEGAVQGRRRRFGS